MVGLAIAYARMGKSAEALRAIHALEAHAKKRWVEPTFIAFAYASIDDHDSAMRWLEHAFQAKTFAFRSFTSSDHPWLRPLLTDARYQALRTKAMATTFY